MTVNVLSMDTVVPSRNLSGIKPTYLPRKTKTMHGSRHIEVGSRTSGLKRRRASRTVLHTLVVLTAETLLAATTGFPRGSSSSYEGPSDSGENSVVNVPQG